MSDDDFANYKHALGKQIGCGKMGDTHRDQCRPVLPSTSRARAIFWAATY